MDRSALHQFLRTEAQLQQQLDREFIITGIKDFDDAVGGIPRGAITEFYGPPSSGKTTFLHALLAQSTRAAECCALVDGADSFDPVSANASGVDLRQLLWVRCRSIEQALKAADLLVHGGGWGVVSLDLSDISPRLLRKLPMSYWYRFRRAVENTPMAFVVMNQEPQVKNCAAMTIELPGAQPVWSGAHRDFKLLRSLDIQLVPRKPMRANILRFQAQQSG